MYDAVTPSPKEAKLRAMQDIETFLNRHRLHGFRRCTPEQFANHAQSLVSLSRTIYEKDLARISEHLQGIAKDVEDCEFYDCFTDGHHLRAADAIRQRAKSNADESCPWIDLLPLLAKHHVKRNLAACLWKRNVAKAESWEVDLDQVIADVWDENVSMGTVRTNVTRLSKILSKNGVKLELGVTASTAHSVITCNLASINQELVDDASDGCDSEYKKGIETRKKEINDRREAARIATENAAKKNRRRRISPDWLTQLSLQ